LCCTAVWLWWNGSADDYLRWWSEGRFSLVAPEANLGWAQGAAMVVGIFSTQAYLQPIFASYNVHEARKGAVWAGVTIILIGLVSAWIGLFMHDAHPELAPREAIPQFFLRYAPLWFAGGAYAVILLSVVMTGAALTLSIATILNRDVIQRYTVRFRSDASKLALSRGLILTVIVASYVIVCLDSNALILHWAFLSMALRGVPFFSPSYPICSALDRLTTAGQQWRYGERRLRHFSGGGWPSLSSGSTRFTSAGCGVCLRCCWAKSQ
jgi:SSS family solute:Na+ symporter